MQEIIKDSAKPKKPRTARRKEIITISSNHLDSVVIEEEIVRKVADIAAELGYKIYAVGGYVRDHYLGRERSDFDFTIIGDAITFAEELAKKLHSKAITYPRFRTAMVPFGKLKLEFVGTRKEIYLPNTRNPLIKEGTLEDDIQRRDFTINTLAVSLNKNDFGKIIDLYNGKKDLQLKIIKTPLDPIKTFSDDPLRMLRAARFAAQLDFKVDKSSIKAIKTMYERISIISQERISDELLKILASPKPSLGLNILFETNLLKIIFPELDKLSGVEVISEAGNNYGHKDILQHSLQVLDNVAENSTDLWLRFAALIHDIAKPLVKKYVKGTGWTFHGHEELGARFVEKIFRRLKLPLEHIAQVELLVRLHQRPMALVDEEVTDSAVRRLAFQAGEHLEDLFTLCKADITTNNPNLSAKYLQNYENVKQKVIEVQEKDKLREFQSPVRGEEIMEICKIPPSYSVGYIKSKIEQAILDGIIPNEYEKAKAYFLKHKSTWLKESSNRNRTLEILEKE
ncbi:MAG: HD domain-containing protein [Ignavibacteria bacterium]|jgi:tRNA nucleotidyltransferase/poly(A) polymerase|nr:HD domain-containing protein [Ignavibacteria bacterium]